MEHLEMQMYLPYMKSQYKRKMDKKTDLPQYKIGL